MRMRGLGVLAVLPLFPVASAGADGVAWRQHVSVRAGSDRTLGPVDPSERVTGKVSREVDYVSVHLDAAFLRNLPGFSGDKAALLGVEIRGLLPRDEKIQALSDVRACSGGDAFLSFESLPLAPPMVYGGREVSVEVQVRALDGDEAGVARARVAAVSGLLGRWDRPLRSVLSAVREAFTGILGSPTAKAVWRYRFTWVPPDTVVGGDAESLFTATRHILLLQPPADAPERIRAVQPLRSLSALRLDASRLVWKADGREYTETPYFVLTVRRYRRYQNSESDLRKRKRELEQAFANASFDRAAEVVRTLSELVSGDAEITATERNLERAWLTEWEGRISAARARKVGDEPGEWDALARQAKALAGIRLQFAAILEEAEHKEIAVRLAGLRDRLHELGVSLKRSLSPELSSALAPSPASSTGASLGLRVWTDQHEYRQGEKMRFYLAGTMPFYARVVYRDASGKLLQLLPNPYRAHNHFEGGVVYEVPSAEDRFDLEVSAPFGAESVTVYAATQPLRDLELQPTGGLFEIKTRAAEIPVLSRGVKIVARPGASPAAPAAAPETSFAEATVEIRTSER
jgi:hypothetical protein